MARNEFARRVRTRMFVVGTLGVPLLMLFFGALSGMVAVAALKTSVREVGVVDRAGFVGRRLASDEALVFVPLRSEAHARRQLRRERLDAYVVVPPGLFTAGEAVRFINRRGGALGTASIVQARISDAVRGHYLARTDLDPTTRALLQRGPPFLTSVFQADDDLGGRAVGGALVGFGLGFVLYFMMLLYGQMVMAGIVEEKQHRVLEVLAASVRPLALLVGKVVGIGAVGMLQMAVWLAFLGAAAAVAGGTADAFLRALPPGTVPEGASAAQVFDALGITLPAVTPGLVAVFFAYFVGGYLLYASVFAAVGAAVEQQQDAQPLLLPLTAPVVLAFVALQAVLANPTGDAARLFSLVPFLSPILMPARAAAVDVPTWEVAVSLGLLVLAFYGMMWLSARVYRIGILRYGKRPTLRELARWAVMP